MEVELILFMYSLTKWCYISLVAGYDKYATCISGN